MKKKIQWVIFKKTRGCSFPGEWWEEYPSKKEAQRKMNDIYGTRDFRMVQITYEEKSVKKP